MTPVLTQLGISAVTAIGAAWAGFQFFAKPWLDDHFEARKQALQHEHAQQIAALDHRFEVLMDRASKLHQLEYTVLPELWRKMALALSAILEATDLTRSHASARGMNEGELVAFLATVPLLDWEKWLIRDHRRDDEEGRDRMLANMLDWAGYRQSLVLAEEFRSYLMSQSIFVSASLRRELEAIAQKMRDALAEYRHFLEERQAGRPAPLDLCRQLQTDWTQMADAVQAELQKKLGPDGEDA